MFSNKNSFKTSFKQRCASILGKSLDEASDRDKYIVLASMLRETINEKWANTNDFYMRRGQRQVYYFSLEFLFGKFLESNLLYSNVREVCEEGLEELGIKLDDIIACEPDSGLGNGGLGRLAACFLDSMASMGIPGHGCGIRYKYGLFAQKIVDGYQVELPDNWLREINTWEIRKEDKAVIVRFGGNVYAEQNEDGSYDFIHENYYPVLAVPYDMPMPGYRNNTVNTLRLWSAESPEDSFNFAEFSRGRYTEALSGKYSVEAISEVLYPDDSNYNNRQLRLKQQYFFVSAGLQSIIRRFRKQGLELRELADYIVIQINDTHPAIAVPELMRLLMDEEHMGWDESWNVTTKVIAYTNHTIMPEALEKWPADSFRELLPRIYMIIEEINRRFCAELLEQYPGDNDRVHRMAIITDGMVKMAHLAVVGSFSVNGVAAVHSKLLKDVVMRDFYEYYPEKFNNKTNGVTHRRWLLKANSDLAGLITETIGDSWIKEPRGLSRLSKYKDDKSVHRALFEIKRFDKERLAKYILNATGTVVDPDSIFDAQVKRIHAYKRQLLNVMHVHYLYNKLLAEPNTDIHPHTFIIAGKAAPSYYFAKTIIKYISELALLINNDKRIGNKLKLVFLENYNVALAELIIPASDISEQISTASKEASGTGNMKFMMNGAVTVGTDDGANIEIRERVGDENFILFGMNVTEVLEFYAHGGYSAYDIYRTDPRIHKIIDQLSDGFFRNVPAEDFVNIRRNLIDYNDEFFVLKDFSSYVKAHERMDSLYRDRAAWFAMSAVNIAMSGTFSSDNTIKQYAQEIWNVKPTSPKILK